MLFSLVETLSKNGEFAMRTFTGAIFLVLLAMAASILPAQRPAGDGPPPLVKEDTTLKVSDHVYVIPDGSVRFVPNVGIIVATQATPVIDTGLGPCNGRAILRKVARSVIMTNSTSSPPTFIPNMPEAVRPFQPVRGSWSRRHSRGLWTNADSILSPDSRPFHPSWVSC